MKRSLTVLVALLTISCSGLSKWTFEATTGGTMELTEDGMVMELEDGTKIVSNAGEDLDMPTDFPIPVPWEDAKPQSVTTTTDPDGETFTLLSFVLERPTDEVMAFYDTWLEERGLTDMEAVDEVNMGMRSVVRIGKDTDGETPIMITVSEFFGNDTVNLGYGKGPMNHEFE